MSTAAPPRPHTRERQQHFTIVASKFNGRFVRGLVDHATEELRSLSPAAVVTLHQVPGAFEIPIVVREIAQGNKASVILALGVILQGRTAHAEHLAISVTNALQQIALRYGVPVINAVLTLENEEQARERCLEKKINRGIEAAQAAVDIANVISDLREK